MVRAVVFIVGAAAGYVYALLFNSFPGPGNPFIRYTEIAVLLALASAAPVCWYFAVRGRAGDRWTAGYVLAWVAFFGVNIGAVLVNDLF